MDKIYDKYYFKIYYWAIKKTNNKEDAEDIVNDIFLAIFKYFNKDIEITKIDNLIWKIAHNIWSKKAKEYIRNNNNLIYSKDFESGYEDNA